MLIIAGHLVVDPALRDPAYVAECTAVVEAAWASTGCLDFSITADSVDARRVLIFERWESEQPMLDFPARGPATNSRARSSTPT